MGETQTGTHTFDSISHSHNTMKSAVFACVLSSASAFVPSSAPLSGAMRHMSATSAKPLNMALKVEDMVGVGPETAGKVFDPLGLSKSGDLAWYRAAEVKHGRVAMLATVGWQATKLGLLSFGDFAKDTAAVDVWGQDQFWNTVPNEYKFAFFLPIFIGEWATESKKPHYTVSETPGEFPEFVPDLSGRKYGDAAKLKEMQLAELKNGRLAMIAIISFLSAEAIPGSVPLYPW